MKKLNKKILLGILVMIFGFLSANCVTPLGKFTVISTKDIDWSRAAEFTRSNRVEGEDMYRIIILVPTKSSYAIDSAVDNALQKIPGAVALVDAVVVQKTTFIPFIYGEVGYYIEGTVLVDPQLALSNGDSTNYLVFYTNDGEDFKETTVSEAEYLSYVK
jgi:hypothetical protein